MTIDATRPGPGDLVGRAEAQLTRHPDFGDSDRLERRAQERYRFALEILGPRLPGVAAVLPALLARPDDGWRNVLRDPVVRMATESAIQRLLAGELGGSDDVERVLELAVGCPVSAAGPDPGIRLLGYRDPPGPLAGLLQRACAEQFIELAGRTGQLHAGTRRTADLLQRACALLAALLPELGPGVLRHIAAVALVTMAGEHGKVLSAAGGDLVPGTIIVDPEQLENPWPAAGRLLHEGLHLKFFDIAHGTPLFASLDAEIPVPWRDARWPIRRVLASFHVYAHMVLFQAAVRVHGGSLAAGFGNPPANAGVSRGAARSDAYARPEERLHYLGEQLLGPLAGLLTPAGRQFVGWQLDAIAPLTGWQLAAPPAARSHLRLSHPAEGYERNPDLTLHPAPDVACLFAFNPETRVIHVLNLAAWVAFDCCDGRDLAALRAAYADLVSSKLPGPDAVRQLDLALGQLRQAGLIQRSRSGEHSNGRR